VSGDSCLSEYNIIENFMSDGIRGLGDHCVFQYNMVKNCYKINDNHDDGFQSWSVGTNGVGTGTVYGIVLRGNTFISYTDPAQPFKASMQGIGCFDGMFRDWIVENNIVITDMWHGLSLYGAVNCKVVNNTVIENPVGAFEMTPWIGIYHHKDGTESYGNLIRNNIATSYSSLYGSITDHNITASSYSVYFKNYVQYDVHLKEGSPAVDAGNPDQAPLLDAEGNSRPNGAQVDIGAYEYIYAPVTVKDLPPGDIKSEGKGLIVYPDPFLTATNIRFYLDEPCNLVITVFDMDGKLVKQILSGKYMPGEYSIPWETDGLPNGIYLCCLRSGTFVEYVKMIKSD
jgi:parallel beta-helix repeat protein